VSEISVVIATYNRASRLDRCLAALEKQTLDPERFEVVVVDDGSEDATQALLAAYDGPLHLRSERQANRGAGAARNRGIEIAAAPYCLFVDDDILADPRLVEEHLTGQLAGEIVGIGQLRLRISGRGGLVAYFGEWWREHYRRLDEGESTPAFWDCFSGNMSAPTSVLRSVGGFDERLARSEDVELGYRLERAGLRMRYLGRASAEQDHAKGFREIVADYDAAGAAAVDMWRRHPGLVEHPPLGDFSQGATRALLLRRMLLALRAPVWPVRIADGLLSRRPSKRLYEFLQLYCFWRSFRRALADRDQWLQLTRGTLILMYHAIGGPGEPASRFVLPARRFRRQLAWIALRRRPVISLDEYARCRRDSRLPPARAIVITFDDGYRDAGREGVAALRARGMPATFFVVAGEGTVNDWDRDGVLAGRPTLDWREAASLASSGVAIGAHTLTHPALPELPAAAARAEIAGSRERIEAELGVAPDHFAYPYGATSDAVCDLVATAGFQSACGIEPNPNGFATPIHRLRRMEVWGTRSLPRFALDLWLGRHVLAPREGNTG
jgi:glycosyltransferase involved in cell wall biosynthesis/peptidoglycan/xylan/chitin deacetylase (PgdA/CDA1 family)